MCLKPNIINYGDGQEACARVMSEKHVETDVHGLRNLLIRLCALISCLQLYRLMPLVSIQRLMKHFANLGQVDRSVWLNNSEDLGIKE